MNSKLSVRDFFWVLSAFLRGKLLLQKAYRPKPWGHSASLLSGMKGMTVRRLQLLSKWWGLRPMTLAEVQAHRHLAHPDQITVSTVIVDEKGNRRVPYLNWDEKENRWNVGFNDKSTDPWGDDNNRFRFLAR